MATPNASHSNSPSHRAGGHEPVWGARAFANHSFASDIAALNSGCGISPAVTVDTDEPNGPRTAEREAGGQFTMDQNYPNPFAGETTVPFALTNAADVHLTIYDPLSRKVASVVRKGMGAGEHTITLNFRGLEIPSGEYIYQLQVSNRFGVYRLRRTMAVK